MFHHLHATSLTEVIHFHWPPGWKSYLHLMEMEDHDNCMKTYCLNGNNRPVTAVVCALQTLYASRSGWKPLSMVLWMTQTKVVTGRQRRSQEFVTGGQYRAWGRSPSSIGVRGRASAGNMLNISLTKYWKMFANVFCFIDYWLHRQTPHYELRKSVNIWQRYGQHKV